MRKFTRALLAATSLLILAASVSAQEAKETKPGLNEATFSGLEWRGIGPALRVVAGCGKQQTAAPP